MFSSSKAENLHTRYPVRSVFAWAWLFLGGIAVELWIFTPVLGLPYLFDDPVVLNAA